MAAHTMRMAAEMSPWKRSGIVVATWIAKPIETNDGLAAHVWGTKSYPESGLRTPETVRSGLWSATGLATNFRASVMAIQDDALTP